MLSRGKRRSQGSTHTLSPKTISRKAAAKGMHALKKNTAVSQKRLSGQEEVLDIMDVLVDISSCLQATEHFIQEAEKEKSATIARCDESHSQGRPAPHISRGSRHLGSTEDEPVLLGSTPSATDLSEAMREKVATQL